MKTLKTIKLEVPEKIIRDFQAGAKAAFPREYYGVLLGVDCGTKIELVDIYVPEDLDKFCTEKYVFFQEEWFVDAAEYGKEVGGTIVGDIHSHPYTKEYLKTVVQPLDCGPSETDLCRFPGWRGLTGLVIITESKKGRLSSRVFFWGPMIPVEARLKRER